MGEPKKRSLSVVLAASLAAVVLLPCTYTASIGPVVKWLDRPSLTNAWKAFYAPLEWAHDHTPLKRPLEVYVGLWIDWGPGGRD